MNSSQAIAVKSLHGPVSGLAGKVLLAAFGVALLTLSAKIQVPFWPVPMTLQTMAVMGIAAAFGSRLAVSTVIAYLGAGFAGLPVFSGAVAGPAYLMGPTGGFLAGFVVIAAMVGYAADRGFANKPVKLMGSMVVADIICFAMGFIWLAFMFVSPKTGNTLGAEIAFNVGIKPYVLGDLVKIALATAVVVATGRILKK